MEQTDQSLGVIYKKSDYVGFFRRLIIAAIDLFVLFLFSFVVLFSSSFLIDNEDIYLKFNLILIGAFFIWYLSIAKRSEHGTIGYMYTGAKIVNLQGERPSVYKMILRTMLLLLGPFELVLDILWLTSEVTRQTLRDKFVGTYVVYRNAVPIKRGKMQIATLGFMGWSLMYREVKERDIN